MPKVDTKQAPIKLQLLQDDDAGVCDPGTGMCTVPSPASTTARPPERRSAKRTDEDTLDE